MKKSLFSDHQILAILMRAKFGGMDTSMKLRLKELGYENRRLKKMYVEERLKAEICLEALEGKL